MSHHFTMDSLESLLLEQKHTINIENKLLLPKNIGHFNIIDTKINDDIFLFKMDQNLNENIKINCYTQNLFYINIILDGNHINKSDYYKEITISKKGDTSISFINEDKGVYIKEANKPFKSIGIVIKGNFLQENLFFKIEDKKSIENQAISIFKNEMTNINTQICANELFYMQDNGTLSNIYKESKVLEIIYNEFNDILNTQKRPINSIKLNEYDIQALYKVKEILINNIQNPPSIRELSRLVKLNEFKLKKGFKEKFHITPYKLLEQYRMQKAKYLLENEDMNVNEVSKLIGYKYQNNFAKIFKQYFKVSPKDIMKSRKYYLTQLSHIDSSKSMKLI